VGLLPNLNGKGAVFFFPYFAVARCDRNESHRNLFLLDEAVKVSPVNQESLAEFEVRNPARPNETADAPDRAIQVNGSTLYSEERRSIDRFSHAPTIANECARYLPRFGCPLLAS
jgi:hypothetical protein